jgi:hypothetical protein
MELPRLKGRVGLREHRACPKVQGEPNWETNELEGFEDVNLHYEGKLVTSKMYTRGISKSSKDEKLSKLQRCHDLLAYLRERTRTILSEITDEQILRCVRAFQQDIESKRFHDNPTVGYLRDSDATRVAFVRQGLQLFLRTNHTLQELDPRESYFRAVNKPHAPIQKDGTIPSGPSVDEGAPYLGNDERLRAYDRHINISLKDSDNLTMCLLIHELAHTPPNHVCFRDDDHNDDFLFFQWLFLNMAQRAGDRFVTRRIYV